ncbi:hypothetical protein BDZ97DRAFT_1761214 [Flammula alnicola]|nr:hypothetical protein BDZ97DRAFT_1761214 [Flammula alnicola]
MTKFKFDSFHLKSSSLSSTGATSERQQNDTEKTPKFFSIRSKSRSFLSFRSSRSQTTAPVLRGLGDQIGRVTSRTPLLSLFSPRPTQSETIPHRRQYTLEYRRPRSLSPVAATEGFDVDFILKPESPEALRLNRTSLETEELSPKTPLIAHEESHDSEAVVDIVVPTAVEAALDSTKAHPEYTTRSQEQGKIETSVAQRTVAAVAGPETGTGGFLHITRILQRAARRVRDEQALSQAAIFHNLAPLLLFIYALGLGVFLPRAYPSLEQKFGTDLKVVVILAILVGTASVMLLLKGAIWLASVLGRSFCDMDLVSAFRKGECVDAEGTHMGEAELVVGNFLFG